MREDGISSGLDRTDADLDEIVRRIAAAPLSYEPGAGWGYSMAIDVLGAVIQKVTRRPLPQAVAELVMRPLDLKDTGFAITDLARLVVHYGDARPEPRRMADDDHVNYHGRPVAFSPEVQARTRGQADGPGWEFGLGGAVLADPEAARTPQAPGTLHWNSAYGHNWFIDRANDFTVVALTTPPLKA
jgi:CubicO group peptidase (beta-lactamase class C family)